MRALARVRVNANVTTLATMPISTITTIISIRVKPLEGRGIESRELGMEKDGRGCLPQVVANRLRVKREDRLLPQYTRFDPLIPNPESRPHSQLP